MPIGTGGISPQGGGGGGGSASFAPPITPAVSGSPGANKYLRSDGAGVVGWVPVPPPGITDPGGVGYLKETAPGTFANVLPIPATEVGYTPTVPGDWSPIPTTDQAALDQLAARMATLVGSKNEYLVGPLSSKAPYQTITAAYAAALADGNPRTITNAALISVLPGEYTEPADITLSSPHIYIAAKGPRGVTYSCGIVGKGFIVDMAMAGTGKLNTYTAIHGVYVRNPSSYALRFTGTKSQQIWLLDCSFQGGNTQLLMDNTFTSGTDGPSQVVMQRCNVTSTLFANPAMIVQSGWLYAEDLVVNNNATSGNVSGYAAQLKPTGTSAFIAGFKTCESLGRWLFDASGSSLGTAQASAQFGLCQFNCVTGTPSAGIIEVKNNAALAGILTLNQNGMTPYATAGGAPGGWSSATLAPIRAASGSVNATPVYSHSMTWFGTTNAPIAQLCDNAAGGALGVVGASNFQVIDQNGVVPGTYGYPSSVTVGPDGKVTAITASPGSLQTYACPATVAVNDVVYVSGSGTADKALASDPARMPARGFVVSKPTATSCVISQNGEFPIAGFTAQQSLYVSAVSAGALSATPPATIGHVEQSVAFAKSGTTVAALIGVQINL